MIPNPRTPDSTPGFLYFKKEEWPETTPFIQIRKEVLALG